nr:hypothetical protein [Tanacetum cinerariifolium]
IYATHIVMENPNHPNDPNVPEGEQAPAAPDGFASQWIDPEVNEEVMDDDDWDDEIGGPPTAVVKRPSSPLLAPRLSVPPTVIENLSTRLGNLEYRHEVLVRKMEDVSDAEVAEIIAIGEIHPRVATVREQLRTRVTEMESHMGILMSYMRWMEDRLAVLEKRLPGPPPGPQYYFFFFTLLV